MILGGAANRKQLITATMMIAGPCSFDVRNSYLDGSEFTLKASGAFTFITASCE